jgi:hypothetical protein
VKPKRRMIVVWTLILALVIGVCVHYGAPDCGVPASGPFHRLLAGHEFVPTHWRGGCRQVR